MPAERSADRSDVPAAAAGRVTAGAPLPAAAAGGMTAGTADEPAWRTPAADLSVSEARPRGRRAGGEGARDDIVRAARAEFEGSSYDRVSVRAVARRSGVDPALVRYYFPGGKAELFAVAFAERDIDPAGLVTEMLGQGLEGLGARLAERVVLTWDAPGGPERFRVLFAATSSGQDTLMRDFLSQEIFGRLARALTGPDVPLRVSLTAAHLAGVLVARYVLRLEPLTTTTPAEIARLIGPALDHYLLGAGPSGRT